MSDTHSLLASQPNTGFPYYESIMEHGTGAGYNQKSYPMIVAIPDGSLFCLGTGSSLQNKDLSPEAIITGAQLQPRFAINLSTAEASEIQNTHEQIEQLKRSMGLNILELAAILHVSRPTIYEWIDSKKTTMHKKNQKRLNLVYEVSKAWNAKQIGHLGSYLHKPIGVSNESLFDLLKSNSIDLNKIHRYLDSIAQIIFKKRKEDEDHETLLRKHGFEPISKEDMEDRLNDIYFLD